MDANLKKVLIGMAAGALGFTMVGCGGDSAEAAGDETVLEDTSTGGEASCGAGSCGGAATDDTAMDPAADPAAGGEEGGEAACGAGSCGGE